MCHARIRGPRPYTAGAAFLRSTPAQAARSTARDRGAYSGRTTVARGAGLLSVLEVQGRAAEEAVHVQSRRCPASQRWHLWPASAAPLPRCVHPHLSPLWPHRKPNQRHICTVRAKRPLENSVCAADQRQRRMWRAPATARRHAVGKCVVATACLCGRIREWRRRWAAKARRQLRGARAALTGGETA